MSEPTRDLLLIRHAKSDWRFAGLDDARRPLNRRGLGDCLRFAPRVAEQVACPQRLLVSPAARTLQTAQALADAYAPAEVALEVREGLFHGAPAEILAELARTDAGAPVIGVVGHNPGLNDLYNFLTGEHLANLPTFAVAWLRATRADWRLQAGECTCVRLMTPKTTPEQPQA